MRKLDSLFIPVFSLLVLSCGGGGTPGTFTDNDEAAQQVGDTMASLDEVGGSSGRLATATGVSRSIEAVFSRWAPGEWKRGSSRLPVWIPSAYADSCRSLETFSPCAENRIFRTFEGCTLGRGTLTGTVTLDFVDAAVDDTCRMTSEGHSVSRSPDYTATGLRGATLTVLKTGTSGQKVTQTSESGVFSFENDGIRRTFRYSSGETLFDFSTRTVEAVTVTGGGRAGRVLDGGILRVTNERTGVSCDLVPDAVTWTAGCVCATSGVWAGDCSDGESLRVEITGCGEATLTKGDRTQSVDFDRCERT